jgi:hypothetical protein
MARMKNLIDFAASPARHFSPASSRSTPALQTLHQNAENMHDKKQASHQLDIHLPYLAAMI